MESLNSFLYSLLLASCNLVSMLRVIFVWQSWNFAAKEHSFAQLIRFKTTARKNTLSQKKLTVRRSCTLAQHSRSKQSLGRWCWLAWNYFVWRHLGGDGSSYNTTLLSNLKGHYLGLEGSKNFKFFTVFLCYSNIIKN